MEEEEEICYNNWCADQKCVPDIFNNGVSNAGAT
jgi:hypothetical protein